MHFRQNVIISAILVSTLYYVQKCKMGLCAILL
jgi:hypothetical protein